MGGHPISFSSGLTAAEPTSSISSTAKASEIDVYGRTWVESFGPQPLPMPRVKSVADGNGGRLISSDGGTRWSTAASILLLGCRLKSETTT